MNSGSPSRRAPDADRGCGLAASISVRGLTVTYNNGYTAVRDVSFDLEPGTICALVGVNGSGKSTIFKAIMGFVRPSAGEVRLCGLPVAEALKRNIVAYVPQSEEVDWNFPDPGRRRRHDGPLWPHELPAHAVARRPIQGRRGARARRHGRLPVAADRRAQRRTEEARVPGPVAGAGGPHHPARRAVHRDRRQDRSDHHRPAARAARAGASDAGLDAQSRQRAGFLRRGRADQQDGAGGRADRGGVHAGQSGAGLRRRAAPFQPGRDGAAYRSGSARR